MMEDGEFGHGQDKTEQADNQEPESTFDGHHDSHDKNSRHEQVNQHCQKDIHPARNLPQNPPDARVESGGFWSLFSTTVKTGRDVCRGGIEELNEVGGRRIGERCTGPGPWKFGKLKSALVTTNVTGVTVCYG